MSLFYSAGLGESAIPDERFEHNDLSGNYSGDTGSFDIQTGFVSEGTYALSGDGGGSHKLIVRSSNDEFERNGLRIMWDQYDNDGGLALATSVDGHSATNYYDCYTGGDFIEIVRWESGSYNQLGQSSHSVSTGSWVSCELELVNDDLTFTRDGTSVTTTDATYQNVRLAFHSYRQLYFDNVQFETI